MAHSGFNIRRVLATGIKLVLTGAAGALLGAFIGLQLSMLIDVLCCNGPRGGFMLMSIGLLIAPFYGAAVSATFGGAAHAVLWRLGLRTLGPYVAAGAVGGTLLGFATSHPNYALPTFHDGTAYFLLVLCCSGASAAGLFWSWRRPDRDRSREA